MPPWPAREEALASRTATARRPAAAARPANVVPTVVVIGATAVRRLCMRCHELVSPLWVGAASAVHVTETPIEVRLVRVVRGRVRVGTIIVIFRVPPFVVLMVRVVLVVVPTTTVVVALGGPSLLGEAPLLRKM